jgi:hypothetical protein
MLIAPCAGFVAAPAHAATSAAAQPSIAAVSVNADAGLAPGSTLRVQVHATPDARRASVTLGDDGPTVPLQQQDAGTYSGTYVVRRSDHIDPKQLMTARVTVGEHTATRGFRFPPSFQSIAMGAPARVDGVRDMHVPQISELMPANGEHVSDQDRVHIGARLSDQGSGVDPGSVRLRINGDDVTADARVTPDAVHYRADLPPGRYQAEVRVRDHAGNTDIKSWTFDVVPG